MKLNRLTRVFVLMLSLAGAAFATGCNTVQGAGQDIQAGGAAIEKAAK
ncbi:MAG: entericidin A/B family lipoprotein [Alcaligenaceae bacterium]|nr:entericidin A/B family lipoprotein [Alcaligenaceae bacterium]